MTELLAKAKGFLFHRKEAYLRTFQGPLADEVLADLAKFCRADRSTFHEDPSVARQLDGRREVWLRIQHHLRLTQDQLWYLYGKDR
jgi:hypothetical protein